MMITMSQINLFGTVSSNTIKIIPKFKKQQQQPQGEGRYCRNCNRKINPLWNIKVGDNVFCREDCLAEFNDNGKRGEVVEQEPINSEVFNYEETNNTTTKVACLSSP